jgi:hypothetical protein
MLATVFDVLWLFGIISSLALLTYGGGLVLLFQWNASIANQRTVARLALHDSRPREGLLEEVKSAALVFVKPPNAVGNNMRKAA